MISYELAKELKDAGFPQQGNIFITEANDKLVLSDYMTTEYPYLPNLSELIEAVARLWLELNKK